MKFECRDECLSLIRPNALEKIMEMQNFGYNMNDPLSDEKLLLVRTLLEDSTAAPTTLIFEHFATEKNDER